MDPRPHDPTLVVRRMAPHEELVSSEGIAVIGPAYFARTLRMIGLSAQSLSTHDLNVMAMCICSSRVSVGLPTVPAIAQELLDVISMHPVQGTILRMLDRDAVAHELLREMSSLARNKRNNWCVSSANLMIRMALMVDVNPGLHVIDAAAPEELVKVVDWLPRNRLHNLPPNVIVHARSFVGGGFTFDNWNKALEAIAEQDLPKGRIGYMEALDSTLGHLRTPEQAALIHRDAFVGLLPGQLASRFGLGGKFRNHEPILRDSIKRAMAAHIKMHVGESLTCPLALSPISEDSVFWGDGVYYDKTYIDQWCRRQGNQHSPQRIPMIFNGVARIQPVQFKSIFHEQYRISKLFARKQRARNDDPDEVSHTEYDAELLENLYETIIQPNATVAVGVTAKTASVKRPRTASKPKAAPVAAPPDAQPQRRPQVVVLDDDDESSEYNDRDSDEDYVE